MYFKIEADIYLIWRPVGPNMFCEGLFPFESFFALVTIEWSFWSVFPHMSLQSIRISTSVVTLVTFERLFSRVLSHCVKFQFCNCNAWILAACASVWLFTRVRLLVPLQVAWFCCFVFTLVAIVKFLPNVLLNMRFEGGRLVAGITLYLIVYIMVLC